MDRSGSLTYESYYGLREKPFSLSSDPRFLYRSPAHAVAFKELTAAIRRREGLAVLTGDIGTGKTTLCRAVLERLDRRTFSAFVADPFVSREDLLKMLLIEFGVISMEDLKNRNLEGHTRQELSYRLYEFLDTLSPLQAFAVLVIDEAQNLSLPLLEEIRILADLEGREKFLQVVLVGQPELRSRLKLPEMRQVDQRVSMRCELLPLDRAGVSAYVKHRLRVAGGGTVPFTGDALDMVFDLTGGVPRVINLLCDRALYEGYLDGARQIGTSVVRKAADRLRITDLVPQDPGGILTSSPIHDSIDEFASETEDGAVPEAVMAAARPTWRKWSWSTLAVLGCVASLAGVAAEAGWYDAGRAIDVGELPRAPAPSLLIVADERPAAPYTDPGTSYVIQVASFESGGRAARLVNELTVLGFQAHQVAVDAGSERGPLLQVVVGEYQTLDEATADLGDIRQLPGYSDATVRSVPASVQRTSEDVLRP